MITSLQNNQIKQLIKLHQKKYRDETKQFLVEGEHLVSEAIMANRLLKLIVSEDYLGTLTFNSVEVISSAVAKKLSQTSSSSTIFGLCSIKESKLEGTHFLIGDGIQDPGNLGTMIRSALSFGFDGVIVSDDSVDFYNDKTVRSTQGALFRINLIRSDLKPIITDLKAKQISIVGTDVHKAQDLSAIQLDSLAIIVGNEGQGVSESILSQTDLNVKIETSDFESLNVAIAAGILLYHFRK